MDKGKEIEAQLLVENLKKIHRQSSSSSPSDRQEAIKVLGKMSGSVVGTPGVVDLGGAEVLADLMHSREPQVQFEAVKMLAGLSVNERIKVKIASSKVVSSLVHVAYKGNVMVKRQVARAFAALATNDQNKERLVAMNVLRPLDALVRFDNDEVRRQAARCLAQLASGKGNPVKIVASGVLPELVHLLENPSAEVRAEVAAALAGVASAEAAREPLFDEKAPAAVFKALLLEPETAPTASNSAAAPAAPAAPAAAAAAAAAPAADQDSDSSSRLPVNLCEVLYHLALRGQAEGSLATESTAAVERIVALMASHDMDQEVFAVGAAAGLAADPASRKLLLKAYALEPLTGLARSGAYRLHLLASSALMHFALENQALVPLADEAVRVITRTAKKSASLDAATQECLRRVLVVCSALPGGPGERLRADPDVAELLQSFQRSKEQQDAHQQQQRQLAGVGAGATTAQGGAAGAWGPLHEAACLGNVKAVKRALEANPKAIEDRDDSGATALHVAAMWGHPSVMELLCVAGASIKSLDKQGRTPLHLAASSGHVAASRHLLELNADPAAADEDLNSPLHLAATHGHDECVELLLSAGAAPFKRNKHNQTPYILAMDNNFFSTADILCNLLTAVRNGNFAALEYLLKTMGRDVNQRDEATGWTPLHQACCVGNLQMVKFLLERGAKLELKTFSGLNCFHLAARSGSKEVAQFVYPLLKKVMPELEVDLPGESGKTAYIEACAHGHPALAAWLASGKGADQNRQDDAGFSGLHHACAGGHGECAGQLIDRGGGIDDTLKDKQGRTCYDVATAEVLAYLKSRKLNSSDLVDAIRRGDLEAVKLMVDGPAKIDVNKAVGTVVPLLEAVKYSQPEMVRFLLERGARADAKDLDGSANTALHLAALVDSEPATLALLRAGAPKYLKNAAGKLPYDLAVERGARVQKYLASLHEAAGSQNLKVVDTLAYAGENVNALHPELALAPLHVAGDRDAKRSVTRLIKHGADVNLADGDAGDCPAHRMVQRGHVAALRALFEGAADANRADALGRGPLHRAVEHRQVKAAAVAVEYGAAKNRPDRQGRTALQQAEALGGALAAEFKKVFSNLHLACAGGILEDIVELVDKQGADVAGLDADGRTPLHYAARRDQAEVVEYLLGERPELLEVAAQRGEHAGHRALHSACLHGASEAAVVLIDAGADTAPLDAQQRSAWLLACQGGVTADLLDALREAQPAHVAAADAVGNNALHHAAIGGQCHVVEYLLDGNVVPYARNAEQRTPYDLAVEHGHIECAVMLSTIHRATASGDVEVVEMHIRNGAAVSERDDKLGEAPLHISARLGFAEITGVLAHAGADPHDLDAAGDTSVHLAAREGHVKSLIALFERAGTDANVASRSAAHPGSTPLHYAARGGHAEACRVLMGYGADPSRVDAEGNTPYMLALLHGHTDAAMVLGDLHRSLASGNKRELEMLLKSGIGVNALNAEGYAALHMAVKLGDLELAAYLLDNGADRHVKCATGAGNTPLHLAVELENVEMIELLVDRGADPNLQNSAGETSLHVAVRRGRMDIIQLLLRAGAKTNVANRAGQTPYQLALSLGRADIASLVGNLHAAVIGGDAGEVASLLDNGADVNARDEQGWTPLHHAVYLGFAEIARLLVARGADVNLLELAGESALHFACMCGSIECATLLVEARCLIDVQDLEGCTPLILACGAGEVALARYLLQRGGANSSMQDKQGLTCLHHAVLNGHVDVVRMLLEHGVRTDILSNDGLTALQIAMAGMHKDCVALLVDISSFVLNGDMINLQKWLDAGASANTRDATGCTPLHHAARVGAVDMCRALIRAGANVDAKDFAGGNTPLHLAAQHDHDGVVQVLLEARADPNAQDVKFRSPLHLAVYRQNVPVCQRLVAANANVDAQDVAGWGSLHLGAYADAYDIVKALLKGRANRHLKNGDGYTPCDYAIGKRVADLLLTLHDAASRGDIEEARRLLAILNGAQINARDEMGFTAMHSAAFHGQAPFIEFLCAEGADPSLADRHGQEPLHTAAARGQTACGAALLDQRAGRTVNILALDGFGRTPLMLATIGGHQDFCEMLLKRMATAGIDVQDALGNTALHYAMLYGHQDLARLLIARGARVDLMNKDGLTPFMMAHGNGHLECAHMIQDLVSACKCGDLSFIMEMIALGADPNAVDLNGSSALHEAARRGLAGVVKALLAAGARVDLADRDGATPLMVALFNGHLECANILLGAGADIDIRLLDGGTALHMTAAGGFVPCAALCLQRGINVNAVDNKGRTPLHLAALFGHADMVDFLLRNGADINAEDLEGFKPLNYALRAGPSAQAALDVLMRWYEGLRSEAERLAELEFARRAAEFVDDSIFEVGGDEMNVVLQVQQLQRLIRFAYSDDVEEQHQAARSMTNLSTNSVNQPRIVAAGGLLLLQKLCRSPYAAVAFQSLRALSNVASHEDNKAIMVDGDALETMITVGKTAPNVAYKRQVTRGLANLASHKLTKDKMVERGVIDTLINAAYCDTAPECQRQAARAFASLSQGTLATQARMVQDGVLEALMTLAAVGNPRIDLQVCWAFGNLAENWGHQEAIIELGATPYLARCLSCPVADADREVEVPLRVHAVRALHYLSQRLESHGTMLDCEGGLLPDLVRTAVAGADLWSSGGGGGGGDDETRGDMLMHSLGALMGFAQDVKHRDRLRWAGGLDQLLLHVHHECERVRLFAAGGVLFCSARDRRTPEQRNQHLAMAGGVPPGQSPQGPDLSSARATSLEVLRSLARGGGAGGGAGSGEEVKSLAERLLLNEKQ